MPSFEEIQKARIANSFNLDEGLSELTKAEILDIEKGGKRAMIGEKRTFAGREYIKTADGWKFHGKGTGSKAQEHVAGALEHHIGEKLEDVNKNLTKTPISYNIASKHIVAIAKELEANKNLSKDEKVGILHEWLNDLDTHNELGNSYSALERHAKQLYKFLESHPQIIEEGSRKTNEKKVGDIVEYNGKKYKKQANKKWLEVSESHGLTKKEHEKELEDDKTSEYRESNKKLFEYSDKLHSEAISKLSDKEYTDEEVGLKEKEVSKPTHKDANDHFVEENGKHYIDTLDPDTGEKKFKPGDKVYYTDDNGKKHKGTISDREHEDGDMFEVDREGDSHKGEDSKEAHGKRGFKEEVGDEDVTGKVEKLDPKEITNKQFSSEEERKMGEEATKKLNSKITRNDIKRGATITYKGEQVKVVAIHPDTDQVLLDNGKNVHMGAILLDQEKKK